MYIYITFTQLSFLETFVQTSIDTILDTKIRGSGYTQLTVTTVAVLQINLDILGTIRISTNNPRFILRISQNNLYLFSLPAEISVPLSRWKNAILKDCIFPRKFLPSSQLLYNLRRCFSNGEYLAHERKFSADECTNYLSRVIFARRKVYGCRLINRAIEVISEPRMHLVFSLSLSVPSNFHSHVSPTTNSLESGFPFAFHRR